MNALLPLLNSHGLSARISLALELLAKRMDPGASPKLHAETQSLARQLWGLLRRAARQENVAAPSPLLPLVDMALSLERSRRAQDRRLASAYSRAVAALLADRQQRSRVRATLPTGSLQRRPLTVERTLIARIARSLDQSPDQRSIR